MECSWLHPDIGVRQAAIEGRGLFANAPFAPGTTLIVLAGRQIDDAGLRGIASSDARYSALQIEEGRHLLMDWDDPAARGNHSCEPNAWLIDAHIIAARRLIAIGEEITTDYATMTADPAWSMPCACGAMTCRGIVRGDDWKRPELQSSLRGHFSPFLERRIGP